MILKADKTNWLIQSQNGGDMELNMIIYYKFFKVGNTKQCVGQHAYDFMIYFN